MSASACSRQPWPAFDPELTVIDGHDNSMVVLTIDGFPSGHLAVNPTTNKVYTGSYFQDQLTGAYSPGT